MEVGVLVDVGEGVSVAVGRGVDVSVGVPVGLAVGIGVRGLTLGASPDLDAAPFVGADSTRKPSPQADTAHSPANSMAHVTPCSSLVLKPPVFTIGTSRGLKLAA